MKTSFICPNSYVYNSQRDALAGRPLRYRIQAMEMNAAHKKNTAIGLVRRGRPGKAARPETMVYTLFMTGDV